MLPFHFIPKQRNKYNRTDHYWKHGEQAKGLGLLVGLLARSPIPFRGHRDLPEHSFTHAHWVQELRQVPNGG